MSKYRSKKIHLLDGTVFDSKKEYNRWCELKLLERSGEIKNLQRQVKYELIPSQRSNGKVVERSCTYLADFVYEKLVATDSDFSPYRFETVVEDTKGVKTKDYIIKRKLMLFVYGIRIKEV